jgi:hypothetical protein
MNPQEAVALCRFTAACCPAQKFDEYTPDAWGLILADIRLIDAKEAVVEIKKTSTWVDPSDIIREVRKVRAARIAQHGELIPPADLDPDNVPEYVKWLRAAREAIGDGNPPPGVPELARRDMKQLERTFRRPQ